MQERLGPSPEEIRFDPEDLDISPSEGDSVNEEEGEHLAEVIELFPKVAETALREEMEGIEEDPNTKSWIDKIKNFSGDTKIFFGGEVVVSLISAFFASGMAVEAVEAFSKNKKFESLVLAIGVVLGGLGSLGSGARGRRYLTAEDPSKLSWAEKSPQ